MSNDCEELERELHEHEEKSLNLFKEAELLHQKALHIPVKKRSEALSDAFAKQKEAIKEIHLTDEIRNRALEQGCEETSNQSADLPDKENTKTSYE